MVVIQGKDFSFYDVDDTLVSWDTKTINENIDNCLSFYDPEGDFYNILYPIAKTIASLRANKNAGSTIIVWSAGGTLWAESVVKTLGLEEYVDCVMKKPNRYYDDLPSNSIHGYKI